jgi:hypothetical protein
MTDRLRGRGANVDSCAIELRTRRSSPKASDRTEALPAPAGPAYLLDRLARSDVGMGLIGGDVDNVIDVDVGCDGLVRGVRPVVTKFSENAALDLVGSWKSAVLASHRRKGAGFSESADGHLKRKPSPRWARTPSCR